MHICMSVLLKRCDASVGFAGFQYGGISVIYHMSPVLNPPQICKSFFLPVPVKHRHKIRQNWKLDGSTNIGRIGSLE